MTNPRGPAKLGDLDWYSCLVSVVSVSVRIGFLISEGQALRLKSCRLHIMRDLQKFHRSIRWRLPIGILSLEPPRLWRHAARRELGVISGSGHESTNQRASARTVLEFPRLIQPDGP